MHLLRDGEIQLHMQILRENHQKIFPFAKAKGNFQLMIATTLTRNGVNFLK